MSTRAAFLGLCAALLVGLTVALFMRVVSLERHELMFEGESRSLGARRRDPSATRVSVRLADVNLRAGEHASFELCIDGPMDERKWRDKLEIVVWAPARGRAELRVALDAAHLALARHAARGACLPLGGGQVEATGEYAVDALLPKVRRARQVMVTPVRVRVLARVPLTWREGGLVLGLLVTGLAALLLAFVSRRGQGPPRASWRMAALGASAALALGVSVLSVPLSGASGGLSHGLALAVIEVGVAVAFALPLGPLRAQLGLYAPARSPGLSLLSAAGAAVLLGATARASVRLVPSTGEAPIETFISWPSGALAFATLGMLVPLAEEVLFRGFLYGALEQRGRKLAFACSFGAFAAAHVQQVFGNWGALLAVGMTGLVLTWLRAWTGSTLVPAAAHLLYNASLWMTSFG